MNHRVALLFLIYFAGGSSALAPSAANRRTFLQKVWAGMTGIVVGTHEVKEAHAEDGAASMESVYFGVGCFWHIQHEFAVAERELLGRDNKALTCRTGYAGGKTAGSDGSVCYHNLMGMADYGKLGHAEVVNMNLPSEQVVEFAKVYFSLYNPKTKDRVDPGDKGPEYRSLIGLPGGTLHPAYRGIEQVATDAGFTLEAGSGNDSDTFKKQLVWVYDTVQFPFYQAEVYHQFHNDFQSPPYGKEYNAIADQALEDGRLKITACPDRV